MVATIEREELKAKMDRGDDFFLVETLSEEKYRHTHLPGALNLPPDRVRELAPELLPDKEADIVVYCSSPHERPRRRPPVSWRTWATRT
jgi:rhodanese-related sulfurtransferase